MISGIFGIGMHSCQSSVEHTTLNLKMYKMMVVWTILEDLGRCFTYFWVPGSYGQQKYLQVCESAGRNSHNLFIIKPPCQTDDP